MKTKAQLFLPDGTPTKGMDPVMFNAITAQARAQTLAQKLEQTLRQGKKPELVQRLAGKLTEELGQKVSPEQARELMLVELEKLEKKPNQELPQKPILQLLLELAQCLEQAPGQEVSPELFQALIQKLAQKKEQTTEQKLVTEFIQKEIGILLLGMGKPTYPMPQEVIVGVIAYWINIWKKERVSNYSDPAGELTARKILAGTLNEFYNFETEGFKPGDTQPTGIQPKKIKPEDIIMTVGGAEAISVVLSVLTSHDPDGALIVPVPYYSLYEGLDGQYKKKFKRIDVLSLPNYQLTAEALKKAIEDVYSKGGHVNAIVTSDPNNPLGTIIPPEEVLKILAILKQHPEIRVVIDGAYEEMRFTDDPPLLKLVPPDMRDRFILLRSGTKALSLSGERVGFAVIPDESFRAVFLKAHINALGHAPKGNQVPFAMGLQSLNDPDHATRLKEFYKKQVDFVTGKVQELGIAMPYKTTATFYVSIDMSDLIGLPMTDKCRQVIKNSDGSDKRTIETDLDIVLHLLFEHRILLAQYSAYGVAAEKGILRITCSDKEEGMPELKQLMDKLGVVIVLGRTEKQVMLIKKLDNLFTEYSQDDADRKALNKFQEQQNEILISQSDPTLHQARQLQKTNAALEELISRTQEYLQAIQSKKKLIWTLDCLIFGQNPGNNDHEVLKQLQQQRSQILDPKPNSSLDPVQQLQATNTALEELISTTQESFLPAKKLVEATVTVQTFFRASRRKKQENEKEKIFDARHKEEADATGLPDLVKEYLKNIPFDPSYKREHWNDSTVLPWQQLPANEPSRMNKAF